jgi:hypothetical protein
VGGGDGAMRDQVLLLGIGDAFLQRFTRQGSRLVPENPLVFRDEPTNNPFSDARIEPTYQSVFWERRRRSRQATKSRVGAGQQFNVFHLTQSWSLVLQVEIAEARWSIPVQRHTMTFDM